MQAKYFVFNNNRILGEMFYWPFQGIASFVDLFCYLCFVSSMLSCLFIAALWSTAFMPQVA